MTNLLQADVKGVLSNSEKEQNNQGIAASNAPIGKII